MPRKGKISHRTRRSSGSKMSKRYVIGNRDQKWHLVGQNDRDYAKGLTPAQLKKLGINMKEAPAWVSEQSEDFRGNTIMTDRTNYREFELEVYPIRQGGKTIGYEYRILNQTTGEEYDSGIESSTGRGDHAKTSNEAKQWAINTADEM